MATQPRTDAYIKAGSMNMAARFLLLYDAIPGERRMQVLTASPNLPKMGLSNCPIDNLEWGDDGKSAIASGSFVTAKGVKFDMVMEYDAEGAGKAQVTLITEGKPPVTSVWLKAQVNEFVAPEA